MTRKERTIDLIIASTIATIIAVLNLVVILLVVSPDPPTWAGVIFVLLYAQTYKLELLRNEP